MIGFSYPFVVAATAHIYLPVYFKLQAKSVHYYLELRFNRAVRIFASVCFILLTCIYLAIVVYAPALALAQGIIHKWHHHILRLKGPFTLGENRLLIDPFTPLPVCLLVCLSICLYIMHVCLNVSVFLISFGPSIQQCLYFLVPLSLAIYGIIYEWCSSYWNEYGFKYWTYFYCLYFLHSTWRHQSSYLDQCISGMNTDVH